jgi:serine/threonine protein kinase
MRSFSGSFSPGHGFHWSICLICLTYVFLSVYTASSYSIFIKSVHVEAIVVLDNDRYIDKIIGNYRIVGQLSSSSSASKTFRAAQLDDKQTRYVLKIFQAIHLSPAAQTQFLHEAQLHKRLKHTHLLPLLDAGLVDDIPYQVTEYVPNGSLRERINAQPTRLLPLQDFITILTQVGLALYYAHQRNVEHAHLKPENIYLRAEREALLTDCTIPSVMATLGKRDAYPANSYPYMAPEQFAGWMSKSSDQYALGCIAYELLTGRPPFSAPTFALMEQKHAHEKPIPPTQLNLLLPIALERVVLKAIEKKSADRYASIQDFLTALQPSTPYHSGKAFGVTAAWPAAVNLPSPAHSSGRPPADRVTDQARANSGRRLDGSSTSDVAAAQSSQAHIHAERAAQREKSALSSMILAAAANSALKQSQVLEHTARSARTLLIPASPDSVAPSASTLQHETAQRSETAAAQLGSEAQVGESVARPSPATAIVQTASTAKKPAPPPLGPLRSASRRPAAQGQQRHILMAIAGVWLFALVITTGLIYTAFSGSPAPKATTTVTVAHRQAPSTPTLLTQPSPTPSPTPTLTHVQLPIMAGRAAPTPTPTPSPSPATGLSTTPAGLPMDPACQRRGRTYTCTITLQLGQESPRPVQWSVSDSNLSAFFSPQNGTLTPGQQESIFISANEACPVKGTVIFASAAGNLSVPWSC